MSDGHEEDEEKFILTLSVIQLLKIVSVSKLSKMLSWKKKLLRRILKLEEMYSSNLMSKLPTDVENTMLGRQADTIADCIIGSTEKNLGEAGQTIIMYSNVSWRLMARLADILMQSHTYNSVEISEASTSDEKLFNF